MTQGYLLMWFEAPLQAWGYDSKFGRRDTLGFPTKSGVLGLLCCALGQGGEQRDWLSFWSEQSLFIEAYATEGENNKSVVPPLLLRDFHMIGSGYDDKDPWQTLLIPKTQEGKKSVGGGTKLTYRYYLQDMAFAVILNGPRSELEKMQEALCRPVWDLYFGRKCCVPSEFIGRGVFDDLESAVKFARSFSQAKERAIKKVPIFKVLEGVHEGGETITLNDVPLCFGQNKQYRDRKVTVISYE